MITYTVYLCLIKAEWPPSNPKELTYQKNKSLLWGFFLVVLCEDGDERVFEIFSK